MRRKIIGIFVCILLVTTVVLPVVRTINVSKINRIILNTDEDCFPTATEADIQKAIDYGIAWLASQQNTKDTPETNPNYGSWGTQHTPAVTALVLIKLQDYAYELGYDSPMAYGYIYSEAVYWGWWYLFTPGVVESGPPDNGIYIRKQPIYKQIHVNRNPFIFKDNPDTNGNGIGIYLGIGDETVDDPYRGYIYHTGILLTALVGLWPDNRNSRFIDYNGDGSPDSFREIAQDIVDWLAYAQSDQGRGEGGYSYWDVDNNECSYYDSYVKVPDNSNSGYAYLGLAAAEAITPRPGAKAFACTVPCWVRRELNNWIDYIQYDDTPGTWDDGYDGGSMYSSNPGQDGYDPNLLRTGNLIFEMKFFGDTPTSSRFQRAQDYIKRHWRETNLNPGWGYRTDPNGNHGSPTYSASYQAIYCLMKGLQYNGIDLIDTDNDLSTADVSWFNQVTSLWPYDDFASVLVDQQNLGNGYWPVCEYSDTTYILSTTWALLTLENTVPLFGNLSISKEAPLSVNALNTITYKINYANPTSHTFHNVYIIDHIPSSTTYVKGSVSSGGVYYDLPLPPYVRWDFPVLLPGVHGSVTFQVKEEYGDPTIRNIAYIYSDETNPSMASAETIVIYPDFSPADPVVKGPTDGPAGVQYNYSIVSTDLDEDYIFYFYDWGDGTPLEWIGPCESSEAVIVNHTWEERGKYTIKVMAVNENNAKSNWTTMEVTMPYSYNKSMPQFLELLFQLFPNAFPLLRQFMG